ncbi:phosphatidate cytidylyltransferase [Caldimonas taiwanensis]|uniref:phosphatidate cytidylyltransferase n=1 Tax=Caldimonas taiwanensis TaxID=307483 RepID=UPI00078452E6|nr:phosphatidate cytidylyltransferase [Caldimonas taiwanensis]
MLKQRVMTAVVLLLLALPALLVSNPAPFALLSALLLAAAGWEWSRLNLRSVPMAYATGGLMVAGCAGLWWTGWSAQSLTPLWWLALMVWVMGGAWALRVGASGWSSAPASLRWLLGVLLLWLAWLALNQSKATGVNHLLSILCLVWAADIAAYFGGRAFGRRKLAPAISPGKSWEGVWCGVVGVLVLAAAWMVFDRTGLADGPSLYSALHARWGWVGLVVVCVFLTAMSVVGDLFESLVKRAAGVKDSSRLLPGHGGVLDRIDALLPVFPIAMTLGSL